MHLQAPLLALVGATLAAAVPLPFEFPEGLFGFSHDRSNLTWSKTHNDLTENMPCKDVTLIYARGTWGMGNIGDHVGPAFAKALGERVGVDNIAVQGVEYPASVPGFLSGGSGSGSEEMRELTGGVMNRCPDTKVVLAGYSQGAQVVHKAVDWLHPDFASKISSVVTYGDPYWKKGYNNKEIHDKVDINRVREYCHDKDPICNGGITPALVTPYHWTYDGKDVEGGAEFAAKNAGYEPGVWNWVKKSAKKYWNELP